MLNIIIGLAMLGGLIVLSIMTFQIIVGLLVTIVTFIVTAAVFLVHALLKLVKAEQ